MAQIKKMKKICFGSMGWKLSSSVRSTFFQFDEILNTDFSAMIMPTQNAVASGITHGTVHNKFFCTTKKTPTNQQQQQNNYKSPNAFPHCYYYTIKYF